jgi:hypothetical protein
MSIDYGFKCLTCEQLCIIDNARDTNRLRDILTNASDIVRIHSFVDDIGVAGWYDFYAAVEFADAHQHQGHEVVVADEYGRVWDECGLRVRCDKCGCEKWCVRKHKHEGECSIVREAKK